MKFPTASTRLLLLLLPLVSVTLSSRGAQAVNQDAEASVNYELVDARLERGGLIYGYMDVEGDLERIVGQVASFIETLRPNVPQMQMVPPVQLEKIGEASGLNAVKAIGISSSKSGNGFHNRTFLLIPGGPHGLLRLGGEVGAPFHFRDLAPAGSDFIFEQEVNGHALLEFARTLAEQARAVDQFEKSLHETFGSTKLTALKLIESASGRMTIIGEIDASDVMLLPMEIETQRVNIVIRLENGAPLFEDIAQLILSGDAGADSVDSFPEEGWAAVKLPAENSPFPDALITANEGTGELIFASSSDYLALCLQGGGARIGEDAAFIQATRGLPSAGTSFTYVTPEVSDYFSALVQAVAGDGDDPAAEMASAWIMKAIGFTEAMASVTSIEGDGIFVASNWNHSHKANLLSLAYANPVTIGLLASMAIPAYAKVRETSQEKAILNNVRMLRAAADQYFLEEGATSVEVSELIGPDLYIRSLDPVAGETYPEVITKDSKVVAILPDGREISLE